MNKKRGIPTTYAGVRFRSRLEAKWAAFFDLLGWSWQYEPFDLAGWIPDFILPGKCPVLVEIKPITRRDVDVCTEMVRAAYDFGGDLMLCGCVVPAYAPDVQMGAIIGWLFENNGQSIGFGSGWGGAILGDFSGVGGSYGLCHDTGDYADRITGKHDGTHVFEPNTEHRARLLWAQAGNLVQWKAA